MAKVFSFMFDVAIVIAIGIIANILGIFFINHPDVLKFIILFLGLLAAALIERYVRKGK